MSRTKEDLVNYRIERAYKTLSEAQTLAASGHWNVVANRLYYARFYAVLALLARNDVDAYTHKGVKGMLGQHFIRSGMIDVMWGKLYQQLFDNRNKPDYEDFIEFDEEKVGMFLTDGSQFIDIITPLAKPQT